MAIVAAPVKFRSDRVVVGPQFALQAQCLKERHHALCHAIRRERREIGATRPDTSVPVERIPGRERDGAAQQVVRRLVIPFRELARRIRGQI